MAEPVTYLYVSSFISSWVIGALLWMIVAHRRVIGVTARVTDIDLAFFARLPDSCLHQPVFCCMPPPLTDIRSACDITCLYKKATAFAG